MQTSILLPVFNTEKYLNDCLDSIIGQSEKTWELLAVDDGSTDGSWSILKKYANGDSRIRIFKNERPGLTHALRLAYCQSSGQLVTRMDSDDVMRPQKLAVLKKGLLEKGEGHLAVGQVEYFSENGVGEGYRRYADWLNRLTASGQNFDDIYKECPVPSPCWMAFRGDLEKAGAFQTDTYPEDYDLAFRLRQIDLKIIPQNEALHKWRDHPDRASRNDPNYRDFTFIPLKCHWFLAADHNPSRPLVLWGAGKKGKRVARIFNEKNISFGWVTNNPEKIGKEIRGIELREFDILRQLENPQIIIAIASPNDQKGINDFFRAMGFRKGEHYFFFC